MQVYNHTRKLFTNGEVAISNLKVMLTSGYTFSASETNMTTISASQVSGNGWPVGGPVIANAAVTVNDTNGSRLVGDNISVTANGGDIGPADGLVVYDDTNGTPLFHFSFASAQTAGEGTPFNINWSASGIYTVSAPA